MKMLVMVSGLLLAQYQPVFPPDQRTDLNREQREYRERQQRLFCANHPQDCFKKETELEKAQRQYRERQKRLPKAQ
jgi:hypothetical protein